MPETTELTYNLEAALARLAADEELHLDLLAGGELHFARALPFLTVYRYDTEGLNARLHAEEAAYCVLGRDDLTPDFLEFLEGILLFQSDRFGGALLLNVWVNTERPEQEITIHTPSGRSEAVSEALAGHLEEKGAGPQVQTNRVSNAPWHDGEKRSLLTDEARKRQDILSLGLEVNGFFLGEDGRPFPLLLRALREKLHGAIRRTCFDFVRLETTYSATHFQQLGNHRVSDLVWEIDRKLVEIASSFPFLMLVTATNDDEAYASFVADGYRSAPTFHYRFLPVDPEEGMRELFNLPIDRVRDSTLAYILRDKRDETYRMLDMLANRGRDSFRYGSMQVFGGVDDRLLAIATSLLTVVPPTRADGKRETLTAGEFLEAGKRELAYLAGQYPEAEPRARLRQDMSGLMVSQGELNVGHKLQVPKDRVEALIQHEIGTHVLTYWNGRAQPLTLLHSGTPGYEDLQEGLAVLGEWFVGGLTGARLRILAARVVGIAHMLRGHPFEETFALLHERHGIPERSAFYTTARIYRCGGFTKDAVYLRGLVELLDYLGKGGELEPLFIGKLRLDYVPLLDELRERDILRTPPLTPRYLQEDRAAGSPKLKRLRAGMSVFDLVSRG